MKYEKGKCYYCGRNCGRKIVQEIEVETYMHEACMRDADARVKAREAEEKLKLLEEKRARRAARLQA